MTDISAILGAVTNLGQKFTGSDQTEPGLRSELQAAVRKLSYALETPGDSIQRIAYLVSSQYAFCDSASWSFENRGLL